MDIYKEVNRQPKFAYINGNGNNTDPKFKGRSGIVIPNRVFVGGICPTATETDLFNLFGKYGTVKAIKIVFDQNGSSKGYGFVTFDKADDVLRLKNDAKNLVFNERRLNIAPAVMKNPPIMSRYPDSYVVPVTPNLYFTNNLPYQYQEGASVYPNSAYAPAPVPVVPSIPTLSDAAYYHQNNYAVPATPYQGAALFYPVPTNTSPVMVGHQPYQPAQTNNTNYLHASPAPATSSPVTSTAKATNAMTTLANTPEVHPSHNAPVISSAPPNISSVPPPMSYHVGHPPQFYNSSIMPPYSGEVYYNMVHSYPVVTVSGQETYIPYYEISESYNGNITEKVSCESANCYQASSVPPSNVSDVNSCDSSPASTINSNDCKAMLPAGPPPNTDHLRDNSYSPENLAPLPASPVASQTPVIQTQHVAGEYNSSAYVQHRGALIYPNTPIPQQNVYFNSMYVTETTSASIGGQCPYSKNLSDHFVSDHLPKRDAKYPSKKYVPPPANDTPPNIPKFPFYINNNYPGFVNRNVKDNKDMKNLNGKGGGGVDMKQPQRPVRNHLTNGGNMPPKPRIFHNQNQYGGPPRPKNDRNTHLIQANGQYMRHNSGGMSRISYDHPVPQNSYGYQNNYSTYVKHSNYEGYKKSGHMNNNNNNGGYRAKHEKVNGTSTETSYTKNTSEERPNSCPNQEELAVNPSSEEQTPVEQDVPVVTEIPDQPEPQVCVEMQKLTL